MNLFEQSAAFANTVFSSVPVVGRSFDPAVAVFLLGLVPALFVVARRVYRLGYKGVVDRLDEAVEIGLPLAGFGYGLTAAVFLLEENPVKVFIDNLSTAFFILVATGGLALLLRQSGVDAEKYLG